MVKNGSIDAVKATMEESRQKAERLVDVNSIQHTDAREIGAEWVCLQAIRELEIDSFLQREGWSETQINTTLAHLITRTVYSPSELKSMRIMDENSAVCELISGNQEWRPGYQSIYKVAPSLYSLTQVRHEEGGDYYLEIKSQAKKLKETSMNRKFKERFEEELKKTKESLTKKNGTKAYEKVIERVGRARQKYPSISKYYVIDYIPDEANSGNMADIRWRIAVPDNVDRDSGVYFLRTNVPTLDEKATWDYYNLTREIECTNRQLKTDLNLRPIHHKKDDSSDAHLFLGLLSYWIVNTIRYKLKQTGETCYWTEIVRRLSIHKAVTTEATNALGEKIHMRLCSEPNKSADDIYERLKYKKMPFRKIKIEKSL